MTFQPRTFDQIVADAVTYAVTQRTPVTDYNVGSVMRTLIEAFALEHARYYQGLVVAINEAQQQAAYQTFGFARLPAQRAYGQVLFVRNPAAPQDATTVIPAGTQLTAQNGSVIFVTASDVTLSALAPQAYVTVTAVAAGASGNVGGQQITGVIGAFTDLQSVTNPTAFVTGAEVESDAQLRARFAQYLQGLHRATEEAILFGVKSTYLLDPDGYVSERVLKAQTVEEAPGLIWVWVHNGVGNTSQALVAQAALVLAGYVDSSGVSHPGWKAAGIQAQVFVAEEIATPVVATIEIESGRLPELVTIQATQAVQRYFQALDVGDICRVESIKQAIRQTPGVLDIVSVSAPAINIQPNAGQITVAGNCTITVSSS